MYVAALVGCLRQNLTQCRSEPGVIVGDDKFDAVQTACFEPEQEIPPARSTLAVGQFHGQHLPNG